MSTRPLAKIDDDTNLSQYDLIRVVSKKRITVAMYIKLKRAGIHNLKNLSDALRDSKLYGIPTFGMKRVQTCLYAFHEFLLDNGYAEDNS